MRSPVQKKYAAKAAQGARGEQGEVFLTRLHMRLLLYNTLGRRHSSFLLTRLKFSSIRSKLRVFR